MTDDRHDFSELLRSPYDPDPERRGRREGESDVPWKPAVIATVLGALVASAFVVYAVATGPTESEEAIVDIPTSTTEPTVEFVQASGLPESFVEVSPLVGMRGEWYGSTATGTRVGVTTIIAGGEDPDLVESPSIAYWQLEATGSTHTMVTQTRETGAFGNLTLEFPPLAAVRDPSLLAYVVDATRGRVETLDFGPETTQIGPIEFNVDGTTVIIDQLTIGDVYAHIAWHVADGGLPVTIDTVVTFVGTDDPSTDEVDETRLASPHLRGLLQGFGIPPLPPLFGFSRSEQLVRLGEPVGAGNEAESIIVEFTITVPSDLGDPIRIPIGTPG